jgi:hypothetical protein
MIKTNNYKRSKFKGPYSKLNHGFLIAGAETVRILIYKL